MSVSCDCCVLSGRGLCDEMVPRPEESYECVVSKKCVIVKSRKMRRPRPPRGCRAIEKKSTVSSYSLKQTVMRADETVLIHTYMSNTKLPQRRIGIKLREIYKTSYPKRLESSSTSLLESQISHTYMSTHRYKITPTYNI
jgi:hypothetical protein